MQNVLGKRSLQRDGKSAGTKKCTEREPARAVTRAKPRELSVRAAQTGDTASVSRLGPASSDPEEVRSAGNFSHSPLARLAASHLRETDPISLARCRLFPFHGEPLMGSLRVPEVVPGLAGGQRSSPYWYPSQTARAYIEFPPGVTPDQRSAEMCA